MHPRFPYNGPMRDTFLPFCRPSISEEDIAAIGDVLRSGWITTGPKVAALEDAVAKRCGAKHAIAATSGTALMHLALQALGVGPGDEVVGPSMTWVSTPNMVELLGGTNVFVDADRDTLLASPEAWVTLLDRVMPAPPPGSATRGRFRRALRRSCLRPWRHRVSWGPAFASPQIVRDGHSDTCDGASYL